MRDRLIELIDDFIHGVDVSHWYSEELDENLPTTFSPTVL